MKTFLRTAMILGAFGVAFVPAVASFAGGKAGAAKKCEKKDKPAACPGGGDSSCVDGKWECKGVPEKKECDDKKKPAACPGGGAVHCVDGEWKCHELPKGK